MLKSLTSAYGAGYRAGMTPYPLINFPDGTKRLSTPACPFRLRHNWLLRFTWNLGQFDGLMKRLARRA